MGRYLAVVAGLVFACVGVLLLGWLLWLLWRRRDGEPEAPAIETVKVEPAPISEPPTPTPEAEPPTVKVEEEKPAGPPAPPASDDLKRIEGIGPKISSVLQAAGISTFARLSNTDANQLRQILENADPRLLRLADPTTWPEQAKLAATGNWEALKALQDELKGGRRV